MMKVEWPEDRKVDTFGDLDIGDWFSFTIPDKKINIFMKISIVEKPTRSHTDDVCIYNAVDRTGGVHFFKDDDKVDHVILHCKIGPKR